jgi:arylsulfatase A-like enzyme
MIRGQGWKYIRYHHGQPAEFLYDLKHDPGETRNLIADQKYAGQREQLSNELDAWLARTGWPKGNE